ncbi:hypothetical protein E2C01_072958 [Portunus trituberculatus]|uniref:Uncharacterized protein n=1 Tax=Portunus trituberculatus TaxID=210409 RepID=A0A5B7HZG6_PORTR|nr:hypothetical protein [Portunus trituberculatus]
MSVVRAEEGRDRGTTSEGDEDEGRMEREKKCGEGWKVKSGSYEINQKLVKKKSICGTSGGLEVTVVVMVAVVFSLAILKVETQVQVEWSSPYVVLLVPP